MKSSSTKLGVIFVVIGLTIFGCIEVWGADWKWYGRSLEGNYYYDVKGLYSSADDNIRVLVKWVLSEKAKFDNPKEYGKGHENMTHWLTLYEFNCENKKLRILEITFWTEEKLSGATGPMLTEWESFRRGSMGEALYKAVCK
jgi:Surface-adhesin protein E